MTRYLVNTVLLAGLVFLNVFFSLEALKFTPLGQPMAGPAETVFPDAASPWFFMFLIACADIQFVWAFIIRIIHPYRRLARLFVWFGFALCLHCFFMVDLFSRAALVPAYVLTGILLGYVGVVIGFNLTNRKTGSTAAAIVLVPGAGIVLSSIALPAGPGEGVVIRILAVYLILCSLFAIGSLAVSTMGARNGYLLRRNVTIMACMIFGFLVPVLFFALGLFAGLRVPPALVPGLMLIVPLCVGKGSREQFLQRGRISEGCDGDRPQCRDPARGGGLYFARGIRSFHRDAVRGRALCARMIFYSRRNTGPATGCATRSGRRDRYAESLQTIAELVSSRRSSRQAREDIRRGGLGCRNADARLILFEDRPGPPGGPRALRRAALEGLVALPLLLREPDDDAVLHAHPQRRRRGKRLPVHG